MDLATDFSDELAAFLKETGITPTGFGRRALGDPNFVPQFRKGRSPSLRTIARARAFMARERTRLTLIAAREAAKGGRK